MSNITLRTVARKVKPLLSLNNIDARRRVLNLYKAWYRQIPLMLDMYDIPKTEIQCKELLRDKFEKNSYVKDIRVIDMLVIKGQMELQETAKMWKQKHGIMNFFNESIEQKPKDFLSKFIDGHN